MANTKTVSKKTTAKQVEKKTTAKQDNAPLFFAVAYLAIIASGNIRVKDYFKCAENNGKRTAATYPRGSYLAEYSAWRAMPEDTAKQEIAKIIAEIANGNGKTQQGFSKVRALFDCFMVDAGRQLVK